MAFRPYNSSAPSFRPMGAVTQTPDPLASVHMGGSAKTVNDIGNPLGFGAVLRTIRKNVDQIGTVLDPRLSVEEKLAKTKELPQATLKENIGAGLSIGSAAATLATAPATLPAAAALGATVGAGSSAGAALSQNATIPDTLKSAVTGAAVGAAVPAAVSVAGKAAKAVGEGAYKFLIPRSMREAELLQSYKANVPFIDRVKSALSGADSPAPTTAADTAFQQGLAGTEGMLGVQAKRASNNIWSDVIAPKLQAHDEVVNMPQFFNHIEQTIKTATPEVSRQKSLLEALSALREDYAGIENVPLSKLQSFKEGWAQFIPEKAYRGQPIAGAFRDVTNTASSLARQTIYKALGPEARQAYIDYGNLQAIQELGAKAMSGGRFKGGFGGFWSAVKDIALTPIATVGGQVLYKTGDGLEFIGKKGAAVLADIIAPTTLEFLLSSSTPTNSATGGQVQ